MTAAELAEAYSRYGALVHRRCRSILRDEQAAEDAAQEVFLRVWRHSDSFGQADSKVSWLYRVAERCCFDILDTRRRRGEVPEALAPQSLAARAPVEDWDLIQKFLAGFDERVRRVAVLHYLDGLTQEAIALATGWSRQTIVKKLALIRAQAERLRDTLIERDPA